MKLAADAGASGQENREWALYNLGNIFMSWGKLDTAELLYEDVLAIARELGDRESVAIGLLNLAMVAINRGLPDRARSRLIEVLGVADERSKPIGLSVLEVCAGLASLREEWERAPRFFGAAEAQTAQTGLHRDPSDEAFLAPLIGKARGVLGSGAFAQAEAAGRALAYDAALLEARAWLGKETVRSR